MPAQGMALVVLLVAVWKQQRAFSTTTHCHGHCNYQWLPGQLE